MMRLKLYILQSSEPDQALLGDIWAKDAKDEDPPVVSDVNARPSAISFFALAPGEYVYRFSATRHGKLTVAVAVVGGKAKPLAQKEYDASVIQRGRTLSFSVRQAQ